MMRPSFIATFRRCSIVIGKEGGEIWTDHYAIPKGAPNRDAAYAFID